MKGFLALVRRQLIESRWLLGLMAAAFVAIAILWTWRVGASERLLAQGDARPGEMRGLGMYRAFGGPAMDYSTVAMVVCCWNHPVIFLTLLGWTIARGSGAVADEIEKGTL